MAGYDHSLVLLGIIFITCFFFLKNNFSFYTANSTVYSWGANEYGQFLSIKTNFKLRSFFSFQILGQLGNGNTNPSNTPVLVLQIFNTTSIAYGGGYHCLIIGKILQ